MTYLRARRRLIFTILLLVLSFETFEVQGQDDGQEKLSLRLSREFGYGLAGQMQGTFSFVVIGPDNLNRVEFFLDDKIIGTDSSAPFRYRFDTGDYSNGSHRLKAVGYTETGQVINSATITRQFVPGNSVIWIVVFIVALVIVGRVATYYMTRSKKGDRTKSTKIGYLGDAICPNCGRSFSIHWWSLKLGIHRYERCRNCGKWNLVRRVSAEELDLVGDRDEESETDQTAALGLRNKKDDDFRQLLDESRFDDN